MIFGDFNEAIKWHRKDFQKIINSFNFEIINKKNKTQK